jgi:competence protein ComEC
MKHIVPVTLAALMLLLTGCGSGTADSGSQVQETVSPDVPATPLTVTFMKVGKADGMILQTAAHTVVIDCGEESDGSKMVARLQENNVTTIDCMILSHYDQDHIGGAPAVLEAFDVKQVIGAQQEEDTEEYKRLCDAVKAEGLDLELPGSVTSFTLDDTVFTVYPHKANDYKNGYDNNCSLVVKVLHHDETMLFTGDAMEERLAEIMDIGDCDLLKVPYHGRELKNLPQFLENTKPEYAVISTKEKELAPSTTAALEAVGAQTYMTFADGTIVAVSDGKSITITPEGVDRSA